MQAGTSKRLCALCSTFVNGAAAHSALLQTAYRLGSNLVYVESVARRYSRYSLTAIILVTVIESIIAVLATVDATTIAVLLLQTSTTLYQ
jgi:hypothetical protein